MCCFSKIGYTTGDFEDWCAIMFSTFSEYAPYIVAFTLILSGVIALKWQKIDLHNIDILTALLGFGVGLLITSLNLVYSNNYLISLGPILTLICALYLRYRKQILVARTEFLFVVNPKILKFIRILFWLNLTGAILLYYFAPPYSRPLLFFICISICAALLAVEIVSQNPKSTLITITLIGKILLTSLILRASAYFISPFPVGADPWAHAEYIKNFLSFAHLEILPYPHGTGVSEYYLQYPIMHLYATVTDLLCGFSIKDAMFIVGTVLALSTIFVYLIVKCLLKNTNIALFAVLLVNFADFHVQWSVQVIGMTFGIALFTILLYTIIRNWQVPRKFYKFLMLLCLFLIVWTHTVTAFVALVSVITLAVGSLVYPLFYNKTQERKVVIALSVLAFFLMLLVLKWIDPSYPFLEGIIKNLQNSLSAEVEFMGRTAGGYTTERSIGTILNIVGFLVFVAVGIFGCLCYLSEKYADKLRVSLIITLSVLFFIFFAFPLMGLRNIVPYRWPAFIYIILVLFIGIGFAKAGGIFRKGYVQQLAFFSLILITTFFMITNSVADLDSPPYNQDKTSRAFLSESEMALSLDLSKYSDSYIISDGGVIFGPEKYYLKSDDSDVFHYSSFGTIDWNYLKNKLIIWRECTLVRVVPMSSTNAPTSPLGSFFKEGLDNRYGCIWDSGGAKAYL